MIYKAQLTLFGGLEPDLEAIAEVGKEIAKKRYQLIELRRQEKWALKKLGNYLDPIFCWSTDYDYQNVSKWRSQWQVAAKKIETIEVEINQLQESIKP